MKWIERYRSWKDMPYAAMNKIESTHRASRVKAMKAMTADLAPDAFADEADIRGEDIGVYYSKTTLTGE